MQAPARRDETGPTKQETVSAAADPTSRYRAPDILQSDSSAALTWIDHKIESSRKPARRLGRPHHQFLAEQWIAPVFLLARKIKLRRQDAPAGRLHLTWMWRVRPSYAPATIVR